MPMNRSPCRELLTLGLLCNPFDYMHVPAGMTVLRESQEPPPPRPTPETLREQGVKPHQIDTNVSLHEQPMMLGNFQIIGREAVGSGADQVELVKFRADIAICDIINLNYRFYPRSAYEGAIKRAKAGPIAQGKITGLLEHPGWEDGWKGRLEAVAARWTDFGIEEKEVEFPPDSGQMVTKPVVWGEGVYVRTKAAEIVQTLKQDGVFVGISSNGYSSVEWVPFGELGISDPTGLIDPELEIPVTGDDLTFLTIDFVALPANSGGQVLGESGGYGPPPKRRTESLTPSLPAPERPTPAPLALEDTMHPKIKALCERLNKTLEQVKTEHTADYMTVLESIAKDGEGNAQAAAELATTQAQLLQAQTQLAQTQEALRTSEGNRVQESRTAMVDAALAEANLPTLPPLKLGNESIDLNAKWRESLLAQVLAAESDEAANTLLSQQIAVRAHELAGQQTESPLPVVQPPRVGASKGPSLPAGDNDLPPLTESANNDERLMVNPYINILRS